MTSRGKPGKFEERVSNRSTASLLPQLARHRPQHEGIDGEDHPARLIGGRDRHPAPVAFPRVDRDSRRIGLADSHALPLERREHNAGIKLRFGLHRNGDHLQYCIEHAGVHRETAVRNPVWQQDFPEEFVPTPPHRMQPTERGTVSQASFRKRLITAGQLDTSLAWGGMLWHGLVSLPVRWGCYGRGMADPVRFGCRQFARTGVDPQRAPTGFLGADDELHGEIVLLGEHQRRVQGQLVNTRASGLLRSPASPLSDCRSGNGDRVEHDVVGQPRVVLCGEPSGDQPTHAAC